MNDSNVFQINTPAEDALQSLLKRGAQELLAKALESELQELLERYADRKVEGKQAVVRNGYLPERTLQTGIGDIPVKVPKVRDRSGQQVKFNSALVPPYLKRTKSVEEFVAHAGQALAQAGQALDSCSSILPEPSPARTVSPPYSWGRLA